MVCCLRWFSFRNIGLVLKEKRLDVIDQQWQKHVNSFAVAAVSLLSFDSEVSAQLSDDSMGVSKWIAEFGSHYLSFYQQSKLSESEVGVVVALDDEFV